MYVCIYVYCIYIYTHTHTIQYMYAYTDTHTHTHTHTPHTDCEALKRAAVTGEEEAVRVCAAVEACVACAETVQGSVDEARHKWLLSAHACILLRRLLADALLVCVDIYLNPKP